MQKINLSQNTEFIVSKLQETERPGIEAFIESLKREGYFEAPASKNYHLNVEGGLAQHSINVYRAFQKLYKIAREEGGLKFEIPENSIILVSLLHDVCKVSHYKKAEKGYDYNENDLTLGHGEKSIYVIASFIRLTDVEAMMIRWHMGTYDSGDYMRYQKHIEKYPEVLLFHFADNFATHYIDTEYVEEKV
jgi:hypothetical protein